MTPGSRSATLATLAPLLEMRSISVVNRRALNLPGVNRHSLHILLPSFMTGYPPRSMQSNPLIRIVPDEVIENPNIFVSPHTSISDTSISDRSIYRNRSGDMAKEILGKFNSATRIKLPFSHTLIDAPINQKLVVHHPAAVTCLSRHSAELGRTMDVLMGLFAQTNLLHNFSNPTGQTLGLIPQLNSLKVSPCLLVQLAPLIDFNLDRHYDCLNLCHLLLTIATINLSSSLDWLGHLIREYNMLGHHVRLFLITFSNLCRLFGISVHPLISVRIYSVQRFLHYAFCQAFVLQTSTKRVLIGLLEPVSFWSLFEKCEATLAKHLNPIVEDVVLVDYHRSLMLSEDLCSPVLSSAFVISVTLNLPFEDLEEYTFVL